MVVTNGRKIFLNHCKRA